jgi:hypothetical protein
VWHSWFWPHAIVNFLVTGPVIFTGFALGYQTTNMSGTLHFSDPHQVRGAVYFAAYKVSLLSP